MGLFRVVVKDGQKALDYLAGATRGEGCPLGMWASFENDIAPNDNWIRAGTTFDATEYPALALYLGGNTVPERYDHNRASANVMIVDSSRTMTPFTVLKDGLYTITTKTDNDHRYLTINGVNLGEVSSSTRVQQTYECKKGDVISITGGTSIITWRISASYYEHPLFIKATSNMSESEATALFNSIQERIGEVFKTDVHDFGNNPTTWGSGFEYTFEETVPVGKYRVHAIIPNDSNGTATWCIMIHSGDVSTSYEGITNWTTGWDVLVGNYTSGNLEGSGGIVAQNHKGTIIECGTMKVKTPLTKLQVGASTNGNLSSPNKVQIVLERLI